MYKQVKNFNQLVLYNEPPSKCSAQNNSKQSFYLSCFCGLTRQFLLWSCLGVSHEATVRWLSGQNIQSNVILLTCLRPWQGSPSLSLSLSLPLPSPLLFLHGLSMWLAETSLDGNYIARASVLRGRKQKLPVILRARPRTGTASLLLHLAD